MPHPSCVPGCKLLFRHDLNSRNKDHPWRPCSYCSGISQKMLHSHYGGQMEEFCRPHCMSQYTVLYYGVRRLTVCPICFSYVQTMFPSCLFNTCHSSPPSFSLVQMGRCDSCRKQGYMAERLQCLGSVRNFCNLPCLLQYCYLHFETSQHTSSNGTGTAPQTPNGNLCHISVTWPWSVLTAKNLIQVKIVEQSVEMLFDSVPVIVWKLLSSSNTLQQLFRFKSLSLDVKVIRYDPSFLSSSSSNPAPPFVQDESCHSWRGLIGQRFCHSAQCVSRHCSDRWVHGRCQTSSLNLLFLSPLTWSGSWWQKNKHSRAALTSCATQPDRVTKPNCDSYEEEEYNGSNSLILGSSVLVVIFRCSKDKSCYVFLFCRSTSNFQHWRQEPWPCTYFV